MLYVHTLIVSRILKVFILQFLPVLFARAWKLSIFPTASKLLISKPFCSCESFRVCTRVAINSETFRKTFKTLKTFKIRQDFNVLSILYSMGEREFSKCITAIKISFLIPRGSLGVRSTSNNSAELLNVFPTYARVRILKIRIFSPDTIPVSNVSIVHF